MISLRWMAMESPQREVGIAGRQGEDLECTARAAGNAHIINL